jgi:hypothetical protein
MVATSSYRHGILALSVCPVSVQVSLPAAGTVWLLHVVKLRNAADPPYRLPVPVHCTQLIAPAGLNKLETTMAAHGKEGTSINEKRQAASILALTESDEGSVNDGCLAEVTVEAEGITLRDRTSRYGEGSSSTSLAGTSVSSAEDRSQEQDVSSSDFLVAELVSEESRTSQQESHVSSYLIAAYLNQVNQTVTEAMAVLERQHAEWMSRNSSELLSPARRRPLGCSSSSSDPPGCDSSALFRFPREEDIPRPDPPETKEDSNYNESSFRCAPVSLLSSEPARVEGTDHRRSIVWQSDYLKLRHAQSCPLPRRATIDAPAAKRADPPSFRDGLPVRKPDPPLFGQTILGYNQRTTSLWARFYLWRSNLENENVIGIRNFRFSLRNGCDGAQFEFMDTSTYRLRRWVSRRPNDSFF